MTPLRVLDICSGYSAATVAWQSLPFQHVGYSEIEAFPRAILEQRHGATPVDWDHRWIDGSNTVPLFGDFTKIEAHHVGPVDLLAGGTPCQSFSVAGKRLGLDDPRGNLTLEFLALAERVRAEWLLWENVPGFLSDDGGRTMGTFIRLLGELGYGFAWRMLDVQFIRVDGHERAIPQRRRRLFVVGHLGDAAGPAAVLFDRESLRGDSAPRREAGTAVAALTSTGVGTCGADDNQAQAGHLIASTGNVAHCLNAGGMGRQDYETETMVAHTLRAEGFDASEDGTGRGTPLVPVAFDTTQITSASNRSNPQPGDPCHPLAAGAHAPAVAYRIAGDGEVYQEGDVLAPLTTGTDPNAHVAAYDLRGREGGAQFEGPHDTANIRAASGGSSRSYVAQPWAVRRLTPTECERLMGVPDGFTAITYRGKPAADGPRYKCLGNSQGTNAMRWIGRGIADVVAIQSAKVIAA